MATALTIQLGCLVLATLGAGIVSGYPSVNTLSYYEPLDYDPSILSAQHHRVTRGVGGDTSGHGNRGSVQLKIEAFNRSFVSSLSHSRRVFGNNVKFLVNGISSDEYDPKTLYDGELEGEVKSHVTGHVIDGVFDGVIQTQNGTFHVERSHKFFPSTQKFHSIIYHEDDAHSPDRASSCGVKGKLLEELKWKASHAVPLNDDKNTVYGKDRYSRMKRQTINNNKICQIRVAADHLYLSNVGRGNIVNTMSDIASLIASVQVIYRETDFTGDGMGGIQPVIVSLEVLDENAPGYRYGASVIGVNDFLDLWSQENQTDFCLSLLLTYRDFDGGVLGLAWVAQSSGGNSGGICENQVRLQSGLRSLNTAIVTFLNFGQTQPRSVSTVTIAHEFGHNFGSPHDPSNAMCSPGGAAGNFIMFPQATDGAQDNNKRFSPCSISSINAVLATESGCFAQSAAFCGNGVLEGSEECDCGSMCSQDNCCNTDCTLTPGSQCSSVEACCEDSCQFKSNDTVCLLETECGGEVTCTGRNGTCPNPVAKTNNIVCNNGRNVCVDGICAGTVCIRMNYTDCQCTIDRTGGPDEAQLCHVCCTNEVSGTCQSSFDLFGTTVGQFRDGGRSCNNFQGYCSNSNPPICQIVDNERTLEDLLDIFNLNTLNVIVAWLQVYWYIPIGIIVGIAIIIILLQVTYRRRKPLKRRLSEMRNNTLRRGRGQQRPSNVSAAQTGGVGSGGSGNGQARARARSREITQSEGERRLKTFFPTVDRETMISVMRVTRSESKAVRRLIDLGYPLQKVPLPRS